jgi:quercetin dioxygenase-like cupin family protein
MFCRHRPARPERAFLKARIFDSCRAQVLDVLGRESAMKLVRRHFLQLAGIAFTAIATSRATQAQTQPTGPKLTQILRKDLAGQGQTVQESIVSIVEFGPGVASPWHMHPGAQEIFYALEGNLIVEIEGQGMMTVKAGECSIIPADIPHLARNDGASAAARALVVHSRSAKDKPLVVPVRRAT